MFVVAKKRVSSSCIDYSLDEKAAAGLMSVCPAQLCLCPNFDKAVHSYIYHILYHMSQIVYLLVRSQPVFKFRNNYIQLSIYDKLQDLLKTHISVAGDSNSNYVYTSINVSYTSILGAPYSNSY